MRSKFIRISILLLILFTLINSCAGNKIESFKNPYDRKRRFIAVVNRLSPEFVDKLQVCFSSSYLQPISIKVINDYNYEGKQFKKRLALSLLGTELYDDITELILKDSADDIILIEPKVENKIFLVTYFNVASQDSLLINYIPGIFEGLSTKRKACGLVKNLLEEKLYRFPFYDPKAFEEKVIANHPLPTLEVDKASRYSNFSFERDKEALIKYIDAGLILLPILQSNVGISLLTSSLNDAYAKLFEVFDRSAKYSSAEKALEKYEELLQIYVPEVSTSRDIFETKQTPLSVSFITDPKESKKKFHFKIDSDLKSRVNRKISYFKNKISEDNEYRESNEKKCLEQFSFTSDFSNEATDPFLPLLDILKKNIIEIVSLYKVYYLCPMNLSVTSSITNSIILRLNCSYSLKDDIENRKPIHRLNDGTFFFDIRLLAALFRGAIGPYYRGLYKYFWGNPYGKDMLSADWIFAIRFLKDNGDYFEIWGYTDSKGFIQFYSDALIKVGNRGPYFVHDRDGISPWQMEFFSQPSFKFDVPPPRDLSGDLSAASLIYDFFEVQYRN
jgi:hypothetical protein